MVFFFFLAEAIENIENCEQRVTRKALIRLVISVGVPFGRQGVHLLWGFPLTFQKMMQDSLPFPGMGGQRPPGRFLWGQDSHSWLISLMLAQTCGGMIHWLPRSREGSLERSFQGSVKEGCGPPLSLPKHGPREKNAALGEISTRQFHPCKIQALTCCWQQCLKEKKP